MASGYKKKLSKFRRVVGDFVCHSHQVPSATVQKKIDLSWIESIKGDKSVCWSSIFIKAISEASREHEELRASYLNIPTAMWISDASIASISIEREEADGEKIILYSQINSPETLSLKAIDTTIKAYRINPLHMIEGYVNANRVSWIPRWIRRKIFYLGLNLIGDFKAKNFGTYSISSVGCNGCSLVSADTLVGSLFTYDLIDYSTMNLRLTFDHRIYDGSTAARILNSIQEKLNDIGLFNSSTINF